MHAVIYRETRMLGCRVHPHYTPLVDNESVLASAVQAYRGPPAAEETKHSSALDAPPLAAQRQRDAANSEFARRLASRYNPRHTKPGTTADQRAADVF